MRNLKTDIQGTMIAGIGMGGAVMGVVAAVEFDGPTWYLGMMSAFTVINSILFMIGMARLKEDLNNLASVATN